MHFNSCYLSNQTLSPVHRSKFDPNDMDKNIHAMNALSGLMQGPFDVGNMLVGRQGVMEMMVALCGSEREVDQLVAIEALIHASTKMSRASFIITNGVSLLKDIYKKTKNEKIKIRALVVKLLSELVFELIFGQIWAFFKNPNTNTLTLYK